MICPIISSDQMDWNLISNLQLQKGKRGNPGTRQRKKYFDLVTAFDIETSHIPCTEQAAMYIWQWQFGLEVTVMGRTWDEYRQFIRDLLLHLPPEGSLVCLVHNLSYEFQWLRGVYKFAKDEVFAIDRRKVLKCTMYDGRLEYRCTYLHSNMSLAQYTRKMHVEHQKLSGSDFDYRETRYPWTPLTEEQLRYCQYDVLGLVEAYMAEMQQDHDKLSTMPLTSTGYVRRDVKKAMRMAGSWSVKNAQPDEGTYWLLKEAFRGGDTHANRLYTGQIVKNVSSADRSSSYPDVLCNCQFPMGRFRHLANPTLDKMDVLRARGKALLIRFAVWGVCLKDPLWGFPYLSRSKCRRVIEPVLDNGRVCAAQYLETTMTDVDWSIFEAQYTYDRIVIMDLDYTHYGGLPNPLKLTCIQYYRNKTSLKGVGIEGGYEQQLYGKSKALLNSIYGCMAQDQCKQSIDFVDDDFVERCDPVADLLAKNTKNAYLCYAWGVWITAWARLRLQEGLRLTGRQAIYCDTDSVKYIGEVDWTQYNADRIKDSRKSGAYAKDSAGVTHYMGVFERESGAKFFKTLGAKKYAYVDEDDALHITIAGVGKKEGAKELAAAGGLDAFREGFTFILAGGTESIYNDDPPMRHMVIDGHDLEITPNIYIKDSTYTVGLTADYLRILSDPYVSLDKGYLIR